MVAVAKKTVFYQANCWFFVSLLQQHLQGDEVGAFVDGSVKWGEVAHGIRSRVKERLRLLYHIPLSFTVSLRSHNLTNVGHPLNLLLSHQTNDVLLSLQREPDIYPTVQVLVSAALVCPLQKARDVVSAYFLVVCD